MNRILIAPSILSADFGRLAEELQKLEEAGADMIHLDLMDGHYVPNLTFGYPVIKRIRELTDLPLDAHLMVSNPSDYIDKLAEIGVQWITFHQETEFHTHRQIQRIKTHGINAGLALNPATPIDTISAILPDLDYVLLMSVNPGYSGQSFIPNVIPKIKALRGDFAFRGYIEVDGGVSSVNARTLLQAGADMLVSASYIFSSEDYASAIKTLRNPIE